MAQVFFIKFGMLGHIFERDQYVFYERPIHPMIKWNEDQEDDYVDRCARARDVSFEAFAVNSPEPNKKAATGDTTRDWKIRRNQACTAAVEAVSKPLRKPDEFDFDIRDKIRSYEREDNHVLAQNSEIRANLVKSFAFIIKHLSKASLDVVTRHNEFQETLSYRRDNPLALWRIMKSTHSAGKISHRTK
jgi:hypothetical protein